MDLVKTEIIQIPGICLNMVFLFASIFVFSLSAFEMDSVQEKSALRYNLTSCDFIQLG